MKTEGQGSASPPLEPVGWRYRFGPDDDWHHTRHEPKGLGFAKEPLYASTGAAEVGVALTDASLAKLAFNVQQPHEWGYRCLAGGGFIADNTPFDLANEVVRALGAVAVSILEKS